MVKLKGRAELARARPPEEGETYTITGTEEVKTQVQGFNAIRVLLHSEKKPEEEYAAMLWMRETAGLKSKLGAFLDAFTKALGEDEALDTSNWKDHEIRIISWKPKNREIAVID